MRTRLLGGPVDSTVRITSMNAHDGRVACHVPKIRLLDSTHY